MSGYTDDEISAIVSQLVVATLRRPTDILGVRRVDITWNDLQQSAASVFVLNGNAPVYVLYLGAQQVPALITQVQTTVDSIVDAMGALGRNLTPINDVSALFDARAALRDLATAATNRTTAFKSVVSSPAFQRFDDSTSRFLDTAGQGVKDRGTIAMTPTEARGKLPGLLAYLKAAYTALTTTVRGLVGGLDDYNALALPNLLVSGVATKAAALVGADAALMDGLTPSERQAHLRDVVLHVLAAKSLVTAFGSAGAPSDYRNVAGVVLPYVDAQHPGIYPSLGLPPGPVQFIAGVNNTVTYQLDQDTPVTLTVPPSTLAALETGADDSAFVFTAANNALHLRIAQENSSAPAVDVRLVLPLGANTATQLATALNPQLPMWLIAEPFFFPLKLTSLLTLVPGVDPTLTAGPGTAPFTQLAIAPGDALVVQSGPDAGVYPITAVTDTTLTIEGTLTSSVRTPVSVGPKNQRLRIRCNDPVNQLGPETSLQARGDTAVETACLQTLGLAASMKSSSKPTTVPQLSTMLNALTPELVSSVVTLTLEDGLTLQTVPMNPALVVVLSPVLSVAPEKYLVLQVPSGPCAGRYTILGVGTPTQEGLMTLRLLDGLPITKDGESLRPLELEDVILGELSIVESVEKNLGAKRGIESLLFSNSFFSSTRESKSSKTHTPFLLCPSPAFSRVVEVGDRFESYVATYSAPSFATDITAVDGQVLTLADPVEVGMPFTFGQQPPPYALIRSGVANTFAGFKDGAQVWLDQPENQAGFLDGLDRLVNPLLTNQNPTAQQIGDGQNGVRQLADRAGGLASTLDAFTVAPVGAVDALLASFRQKGSTRAVTILLGGSFQDFFGLSQDGASYSGALQEAARDVARNDVAVSKVNRADTSRSQLTMQAETGDPEHGGEDLGPAENLKE